MLRNDFCYDGAALTFATRRLVSFSFHFEGPGRKAQETKEKILYSIGAESDLHFSMFLKGDFPIIIR